MDDPDFGVGGRGRSRLRLWVLIVSSGVLVPVAIAFTDSKAVLVGALIGLCLYQVRQYHFSSIEVRPGREPEDSDRIR